MRRALGFPSRKKRAGDENPEKPGLRQKPRSATPLGQIIVEQADKPLAKKNRVTTHSHSGKPPHFARSERDESTDACKVIDDLPDETLLHIFFMLPKFSDNLAVRRVSRRWRNVAKDLALVQSYFRIGDPWRMNELKFALPADSSWLMMQRHLRPPMRTILVDWLVEVHQEFRLAPKTLFLSVAYLDRLLLLKPHIERQVFQLYGLTCLWIASKYEDTLSNPIADLVWICDDAYSRQQFEHCEMEVLITLEWRVAQVTTRCFVEETLADSKSPFLSPREVAFTHYLCELSLLEPMILRKYRPSTIAMAAIFAALVSSAHWIGCTAPSDVPSWLCDAADLPGDTIRECAHDLLFCHRAVRRNGSSIQEKYSLPVLHGVAQLESVPLGLVL